MQIECYKSPLLGSNMYLLGESGHAILIDSFYSGQLVGELAGRYSFDYIIMTHEHYDHISGGNALRASFGCPIVASRKCADRMTDPTKNFSRYYEAFVEFRRGDKCCDSDSAGNSVSDASISAVFTANRTDIDYACGADETFTNALSIDWCGNEIKLVATPGHSPGSICVLANGVSLFSGDTLLPGNVPITRFPGGSKSAFENTSLPWLLSLAAYGTVVYPGHGEPFTLAEHPLIAGKRNAT